MISKRLKEAIKLYPDRQYKLARKVGIHQSALSQIVNDIIEVKPGNPWVLKIGKVLKIPPEELFTEE